MEGIGLDWAGATPIGAVTFGGGQAYHYITNYNPKGGFWDGIGGLTASSASCWGGRELVWQGLNIASKSGIAFYGDASFSALGAGYAAGGTSVVFIGGAFYVLGAAGVGYAGWELGTTAVNTPVGKKLVNSAGNGLGSIYYGITAFFTGQPSEAEIASPIVLPPRKR